MNGIDYAILVILVVSTLISFMRGFVREVLSLLAWICAIWIAVSFSGKVSILLQDQVLNESLRMLIAFVGLFIISLIIASLANFLAGQLVKKTGFSGTDRMVGVIFGLARGGLVVSVIVLALGFTTVPQEPWWNQSILLEHFQTLAVWMQGNFPADVTQQFAFDSDI